MLNCIKESFNLTNKYLILATPLILFSLFSSLYIFFLLKDGNFVSLLIAGIMFVLMLGAFIAGWFYMIREGIKNPNDEDPNLLIKVFPEGVGEYFLPSLGLVFVICIVSLVLITASFYVGMKYIGDLGFSSETIYKAFADVNALKAFLMSLSEEQLIKFNAWNLLLFFTMIITYFYF